MWDLQSVCGVQKCKCQHFYWQRGLFVDLTNTTLHHLRGYNSNQPPTVTLESSSNTTGDIYDEDPSWRQRNSCWNTSDCVKSASRYAPKYVTQIVNPSETKSVLLLVIFWWTSADGLSDVSCRDEVRAAESSELFVDHSAAHFSPGAEFRSVG